MSIRHPPMFSCVDRLDHSCWIARYNDSLWHVLRLCKQRLSKDNQTNQHTPGRMIAEPPTTRQSASDYEKINEGLLQTSSCIVIGAPSSLPYMPLRASGFVLCRAVSDERLQRRDRKDRSSLTCQELHPRRKQHSIAYSDRTDIKQAAIRSNPSSSAHTDVEAKFTMKRNEDVAF